MNISICVFGYNRPDEIKNTLAALFSCNGISDYVVRIFCDGQKSLDDSNRVLQVRGIAKSYEDRNNARIIERNSNFGLSKSVISGVNQAFVDSDCVIVVEDDLILHPGSIEYLANCLTRFEAEENVQSISLYSPYRWWQRGNVTDSLYIHPRPMSWGWATWKNRWERVNWEIDPWEDFHMRGYRKNELNALGTDVYYQFEDLNLGKINSWYFKWCYHAFINNQMTIYPPVGLVENCGSGKSGTHRQSAVSRAYSEGFAYSLDKATKDIYFSNCLNADFNYSFLRKLRRFAVRKMEGW